MYLQVVKQIIMKEKYLHYLWKYKLLPFHQMYLTNGDSFKVVYQGDYNAYESGPDFLNAKIEINGIMWIGNVELHVKSKDWFLHGHQNDNAYDNVVLHVVYDHNGEVVQNNNLLPTLELKAVIQDAHYKKYISLFKNKQTILCGSQLESVAPIYRIALQERAIFQRLVRKTLGLELLVGSSDPKQILYFLLARAFGTKINQLPFEEITQRLPISLLKKLKKKEQAQIVQLTSGMLQTNSFTELLNYSHLLKIHEKVGRGMVNHSSWKFGGTRPGNSPEIRIQQFASILEKFDFEISFLYLEKENFLNYCMELLTIVESDKLNKASAKELTKSFKQQIIINCFVPFLFWFGQNTSNDILVDKSIDLLHLLPSEMNSVTEKWKKLGCSPNNAAESQAMLEIFNEFCTKKKCLSCDIGIQLLSK